MARDYLGEYFKFGEHNAINRIGGTEEHIKVLRRLIIDMQELGMEIVYDDIRKCLWYD